tara:strand:+ start:1093 stop:1239 length:147 start_codon:yes stop_codon:yes gene_type:complete
MEKIIDEIELRVCKCCDAPLPYKPEKHSYFKKNNYVCDDCLLINKNES